MREERAVYRDFPCCSVPDTWSATLPSRWFDYCEKSLTRMPIRGQLVGPANALFDTADDRSGRLMASRPATCPLLSQDLSGF
jgi:hypothetical protein